jgi:hypothetical protein
LRLRNRGGAAFFFSFSVRSWSGVPHRSIREHFSPQISDHGSYCKRRNSLLAPRRCGALPGLRQAGREDAIAAKQTLEICVSGTLRKLWLGCGVSGIHKLPHFGSLLVDFCLMMRLELLKGLELLLRMVLLSGVDIVLT